MVYNQKVLSDRNFETDSLIEEAYRVLKPSSLLRLTLQNTSIVDAATQTLTEHGFIHINQKAKSESSLPNFKEPSTTKASIFLEAETPTEKRRQPQSKV